MKTREIAILAIATITNILLAGFTIGSFNIIPASAISLLSTLSSFLVPFITMGAIYVAYLAYSNQESTNRASISKTISNTIKSDLSDLKESINSASILDRTQTPNKLLFSNEAAAHFVSYWWIPQGDNAPLTSDARENEYSSCQDGLDYISEIVESFEALIAIDKDVQANRTRMVDTDLNAVDSTLKSLIKICFARYPSVFQRLRFGITYLDQKPYLEMNSGFGRQVAKTSEAISIDRRYDSVIDYMKERGYIKDFRYTPNNDEIISNLKFLDKIKTRFPSRDYRAV